MTKRMWGGSICALVVVLLVGAQGCGAGSGSPTLSKSEFIKQAKSICQNAEQERGEVFAQLNEESAGKRVTQQVREKAVLRLVEPYARQAEQLAQLNPPRREEKKVEAMVAAMEQAVSQAKESPESLLSSTTVFQKPNTLVEEYGLKHCSF